MTDLNDIVGNDLEPGERERLERVHALLAAGRAAARAARPRSSTRRSRPSARVVPFPRRYRYTALAAAAVAACALFGLGYLVGRRPRRIRAAADGRHVRARTRRPPSSTLFEKDAAGNWPMELDVSGLAARAATSSGSRAAESSPSRAAPSRSRPARRPCR